MDCRFTKDIILGLSLILHRAINWNEPTYLLNVIKWTRTEREMRYLPFLMTWQIWLLRNRVIFEDLCPSTLLTIHIIKEQLTKRKVKVHTRTPRNLFGLELVYDFPIGFFYGASTVSKGGVGVHLMINKDH